MTRVPFTRNQLWALFLVVAVASLAGVGVASHFAADVSVSNGLAIGSTTGPTVTVSGSFHPDLSGDWAGSDNVRIITGQGNMTVTASGAADLTVAPADIEGTWTVVTDIDGTPSITIDPDDKAPVTLGTDIGDDRINRFNFTAGMAPDDDNPDFAYEEDGDELSATVEGSFTDGTQYGAVDADTNVGLDVGVANANGEVTFAELPASSHTVEVEELGTLFIREETADHPRITGCNATVRFFEQEDQNPTIVERTDADGNGKINLTGLPIDESFVATVKCGGYHNRTILLPDLSQQETVFLLDKNRTAVENRFTVDDNTGDFQGTDAQIIIQKAINRSHYGGDPAGFSWTNIAGDDIGADEAFVVDLEEEDRYRIIVQNQAGETRILGAYTAETTGTIPLTIGQVSFAGSSEAGAAFNANLRELESGRDIRVAYFDSQSATTQLRIRVKNTSSGTVFYDSTTADPSQRHVETIPLTGHTADSFEVIINASRTDQPDIDATEPVGDVGTLFNFGIDDQILSLLGWILWLAFTLFFALRSPVLAPAASVLLAAGLVAVGVMFISPVLLGWAGAIGMFVLIAGRRG